MTKNVWIVKSLTSIVPGLSRIFFDQKPKCLNTKPLIPNSDADIPMPAVYNSTSATRAVNKSNGEGRPNADRPHQWFTMSNSHASDELEPLPVFLPIFQFR